MKKAFDPSAARKILRDGLKKKNPSNPDLPMWTLEDLDKKSPGWRYVEDIANGNNKLYPMGYAGIKHRNLARDVVIEEAVQAEPDPKDFDSKQHKQTDDIL